MTQTEAVAAVRGYLTHSGGSELSQLWNGLRREVTQAQIRAALKALGAVAFRSWNRWLSPTLSPHVDRPGFTLQKFTVYKLPD